MWLYFCFCLFICLCTKVQMCDILFVFTLKSTFFTHSKINLHFYSARNWQLQLRLILNFFHVFWWVVKQQKESAVIADTQSKSQWQKFEGCQTSSLICTWMGRVQSRHDTLGGKEPETTENWLLTFTKKVQRDQTGMILHFLFSSR